MRGTNGGDEGSHVVGAIGREPHSRHGVICELDLDSPDVCGLPPAGPGHLPLVLDKACPHHSHVHHCVASRDDKAAEVIPHAPEHPRVLREHKALPVAWAAIITSTITTRSTSSSSSSTTATSANIAQDIQVLPFLQILFLLSLESGDLRMGLVAVYFNRYTQTVLLLLLSG